MNRGIETAFWGTLGKDPELKTSKTGNPFATMNVAVTVGHADDGKDATQWVRLTCFGDNAKNIVSRAKKGDRVYCEGSLTLNTWESSDGETRFGLNVAAWKVERVASIGKHRQPQENGSTSHWKQEAGQVEHAFDDPMPF